MQVTKCQFSYNEKKIVKDLILECYEKYLFQEYIFLEVVLKR